MSNIYFHVDYELINQNVGLPEPFFKQGICEYHKGVPRFTFVGVASEGEDVYIVFPKGEAVSDSRVKNLQFARLLLSVLTKYKRGNRSSEFIDMSTSGTGIPLGTCMWLIEDYFQFGVYRTQSQRREMNGRGRADWTRTIKQTTPYLLNREMVYLDLITSRKQNADNELTRIHEYVMQRIQESLGWLLGFDEQIGNDLDDYEADQALLVLNRALNQAYMDREIQLFQHMIQFFNKRNQMSQKGSSIYGTDKFQHIWEKMCAIAFEHEPALGYLVPKPYWITTEQDAPHYLKQLPDILFRDQGALYILDAKYYRVRQGVDKLPGWHDLVKQFFYVRTIKNRQQSDGSGFSSMHNVFLFPAKVEEGIRYHSYAGVEDNEADLGQILSYEVDLKTMMLAYVQNRQTDVRQRLVGHCNRVAASST